MNRMLCNVRCVQVVVVEILSNSHQDQAIIDVQHVDRWLDNSRNVALIIESDRSLQRAFHFSHSSSDWSR